MFTLFKSILPYLEIFAPFVSIILFMTWLILRNSKIYTAYLQRKAIRKFQLAKLTVELFNKQNPHNRVTLETSWIDIFYKQSNRTNNFLLGSLVFIYISFVTSTYHEVNSENFYKLLTISTTLFLAGLQYIQQLNRR